jgi:hypothetical protein
MESLDRKVLNEGRLRLDRCALEENEKQNRRIDDYNLYNPIANCNDRNYEQIAECNNFVPNNGYGYANSCNVDVDSLLRNGKHFTYKNNLNQEFRKCGSGHCENDRKMLENRIKRGNDYGLKSCDTISEVSTLDLQFIPMVPCLKRNIQNPNNIVEPWGPRGGHNTSDVLYQKRFLENQGYKFVNGIAVESCGFKRNDNMR